MKLSPLAERLIAQADAKAKAATDSSARPAIAVTSEAPGAQAKSPAWLKVREIAEKFDFSDVHVSNLIAGGDIDVVIDVRSDDARKPAYRLLAASVARFERIAAGQKKQPETDLEAALQLHAKTLPAMLSAAQTADYIRCSDDHMLSLARHFLNVAASGSSRCALRVPRLALFEFIRKRRVA